MSPLFLFPLLFHHHSVNPSIGSVPLSAHGDAHLSMEEFILAANHNRGVVNECRRANTSTTLMSDFCLSVSQSLWVSNTLCLREALCFSSFVFYSVVPCACVCVFMHCIMPQLTINKLDKLAWICNSTVCLFHSYVKLCNHLHWPWKEYYCLWSYPRIIVCNA